MKILVIIICFAISITLIYLITSVGQWRREIYVESRLNSLPKEKAKAMLDADVIEGMTSEEVILCWGEPLHKEVDDDFEVWRYINHYKELVIKESRVVEVKEVNNDFKNAFLKGSIAIGMDKHEVKFMLGAPDFKESERIDRTIFTSWKYTKGDPPHLKVAFENERVVSFQEI